ncbi:MAG: MotA/TolQ/ExbB proton channel family protein [Parahaliea sp.]
MDLLARSGPILGLMGTLIPLGPGLSALGSGNIDILATALTVAFDTTVIGLLVGLVAYIIGRLRRRWYEAIWRRIEGTSHAEG